MKPLIVLIVTFLISLGITYLLHSENAANVSGRIAMAVMLLFTSIGHFKFSKGMEMMMPAFVPAKKFFVLFTGMIEILAAIGLLIPSTIKITGILLIIFFVLILPTNIYAAIKNVNLEKADHNGSGLKYLWFRIPLQVLFIAWIWFFTLHQST